MVHRGHGTATNECTMTLWSTEAATRQTHTQGGGVAKTLGPSGSDWRSSRADSMKPSAMSVNQTMQELGQCSCVCPLSSVCVSFSTCMEMSAPPTSHKVASALVKFSLYLYFVVE